MSDIIELRVLEEQGVTFEIEAEQGVSFSEDSYLPQRTSEPYEGDYIITPDFVGTILPTREKTTTRDIEVEKIPVFFTENISGGNTVIIGG